MDVSLEKNIIIHFDLKKYHGKREKKMKDSEILF